jgi:hypothetical protein
MPTKKKSSINDRTAAIHRIQKLGKKLALGKI